MHQLLSLYYESVEAFTLSFANQASLRAATFFSDTQDHDSFQVASFAPLVRLMRFGQRHNRIDTDAQLPCVDQLTDGSQMRSIGTDLELLNGHACLGAFSSAHAIVQC
jgi:hypothetical protein